MSGLQGLKQYVPLGWFTNHQAPYRRHYEI